MKSLITSKLLRIFSERFCEPGAETYWDNLYFFCIFVSQGEIFTQRATRKLTLTWGEDLTEDNLRGRFVKKIITLLLLFSVAADLFYSRHHDIGWQARSTLILESASSYDLWQIFFMMDRFYLRCLAVTSQTGKKAIGTRKTRSGQTYPTLNDSVME